MRLSGSADAWSRRGGNGRRWAKRGRFVVPSKRDWRIALRGVNDRIVAEFRVFKAG
jgi:hypothetical protein